MTFNVSDYSYNPNSDQTRLNCDDEDDCVEGSGSGLSSSAIDHDNVDDNHDYELSTEIEESEQIFYPTENFGSGKYML